MRTPMQHLCLKAAIIATVLGAGLTSVRASTGAIFTSCADGCIVDQNIYPDKESVYLNGGPQNENGPGLNPGVYYFQVTDPSGTVLLSTDDAVCRQLIVDETGHVAGATGVTPHANGIYNPANFNTPVQMIPFADTPNNGGEYKVWLIGPVVIEHHNGGKNGPYDTCNVTISPTDAKVLVFDNSDAKTDNFKIKAAVPPPDDNHPITLGGIKYYDLNANGILDTGEVGVTGFQIEVVFSLSDNTTIVKSATTNSSGAWSITSPGATELTPGTTVVGFTAAEIQPAPNVDGSYWMQTGPILGDETATPHVVLDNLQNYCWTGSLVGRTTDITGLDFGNICVHQPTGGFTLGYWSNKNGQAVLQSNDPAWRALLNALNLRKAGGEDFVVPVTGGFAAAYKEFRTWDLGATATNMAYMLSAQLSATSLNTAYKGLSAATLIYLPSESAMQTNLAECYGANVVSIQTILTEANADLGTPGHENTVASGEIRDHQECLKNILDNINNNKLLFVSPVPGPVVYPQ